MKGDISILYDCKVPVKELLKCDLSESNIPKNWYKILETAPDFLQVFQRMPKIKLDPSIYMQCIKSPDDDIFKLFYLDNLIETDDTEFWNQVSIASEGEIPKITDNKSIILLFAYHKKYPSSNIHNFLQNNFNIFNTFHPDIWLKRYASCFNDQKLEFSSIQEHIVKYGPNNEAELGVDKKVISTILEIIDEIPPVYVKTLFGICPIDSFESILKYSKYRLYPSDSSWCNNIKTRKQIEKLLEQFQVVQDNKFKNLILENIDRRGDLEAFIDDKFIEIVQNYFIQNVNDFASFMYVVNENDKNTLTEK
ncbi:hypothetical protein TVAG_147650 [Trichomonas vaginalis G3]|uniref:Uncharacterized protein n=1 Tax=Trichomonas vaginalis (strain ATCC PRA-98 / G3) TaxID=412133 RepID=A2GA46_TRIV3|nr:hypothetical protein TVAG_147650 [Trichomonas vaginalis G3]|eukprot:XP_001298903.1 hypothetical protein [Trichomonas vaginalis G3]